MGTSEYSKGKGSRRFPGRSGGRGRRKAHEWKSRAAHAVEPASLLGKTIQLSYGVCDACKEIYLLDQEFARHGIAYAVEYSPGRWFSMFTVSVLVSERKPAEEAIWRIRHPEPILPKPGRAKEEPELEHRKTIRQIEPVDLPAHFKNHPWEFAVFSEFAGHSYDSKLIYRALIFRNNEHITFGIREWNDPGASSALGKMARRIVVDADFRQSLSTNDHRVQAMWDELE